MSLVLAHFAVGATMTALVLHVFFREFRYKRTGTVLGGVWGLVPDFHAVSPMYADTLRRLDESRWGDLFWFHRTMDRLEDGAGSPRVALALVVILFLVVAATEWHERQTTHD